MSGYREYPFGYQMREGRICFHAPEAQTVRSIYTQYIDGRSYQAIADRLSRGGVSYHSDTPLWNKHMVKRILENCRYLGTDELPALIDDTTFQQAANRRTSKTAGFTPPPPWANALKKKIQCDQCGLQMQRDTRMRFARWYCPGDEAHPAHYISEEGLAASITEAMNSLILNPLQVEMPSSEDDTRSNEALRLDNEIRRLTERPGCDEAKTVGFILAAAAERYGHCDDGSSVHLAHKLREQLQNATPSDQFDDMLFSSTVQTVHLMGQGAVRLTLLTGQTIEQRTDST